ncbi:RHS repeat domain-containing protein [Niabella drilacis]|nr:RHS repeat domain-containing protein [Niabella drilacis]
MSSRLLKILFAFFLSILCCSYAISQVNDPQQKTVVVPPSPDAASLGKYGEIPVSLYTGTPSINIPVSQAESRLFTLPISLSYDAKGIQVNDLPSKCGLGWSINTAGAITRTVLGKPDESNFGYNTKAGDIPSGLSNIVPGTNYLRNLFNNTIDAEADVFYFNFNGHSGKFSKFGNEYRTIPYSKLKITPIVSAGSITGFTIVDNNGDIYEFLTFERSSSSYSSSQMETENTSAWFLTKIVDPLHTDSLVFSYDAYGFSNPRILASETKKRLNQPNVGGQLPTSVNNSQYLDQNFNSQRLKQISGPNCLVNFYYSLQNGLNSDVKIDSIIVSNMQKVVDKVAFSYSSHGGKIVLDSLKTAYRTVVDNQTYKFEYLNPSYLPSVSSKAQDHWGFYNGVSNSTLVPTFNYYQGVENGGDRHTEESRALTGLLTKITYPTGGSSAFEYESNQYGLVMAGSVPGNYSYKDETYSAVAMNAAGRLEGRDTVELSESTPVEISYRIFNCNPSLPGCQSPHHEPSEGKVYVQAVNSTGYVVYVEGGTIDDVRHGSYKISSLSPGKYVLYASAPGQYDKASVFFKYRRKLIDTTGYRLGPGARIRKITHSDGIDTTNNRIQWFEYKMPGEGASSGVLLTGPVYQSNYIEYSSAPGIPTPTCGYENAYTTVSSNSTVQLGTTSGSYIGYQAVTEIFEGSDSAYKTISYFTSPADYMDTYNGSRTLPPTSYDYKRGLLVKKEYYNQEGQLVKQEKMDYLFDTLFRKENLNLRIGQQTYCIASTMQGDGTYSPEKFYAGYYKNISEWVHLKSDTVRLFDPVHNTSLQTTNTYRYDTSSLLVARVETQNSNGETIVKSITYPYNYNLSGVLSPQGNVEGIAALQKKNILTRQIETYKSVSLSGATPATTEAQLFTYDPSNLEIDCLYQLKLRLPVTDFSAYTITGNTDQMDSRYMPRETYKYGKNRRLISVVPEDGVPTHYLWGYKGQYPVAKIVGSNYSTIRQLVDSSVLNNGDSVQIRQQLSNLRNSLSASSGVLVTTFLYDPLIGMTSQTTPSGNTIYYDYDGIGRLIAIRDGGGNIIKKICYSYAGQVVDCNTGQVIDTRPHWVATGNLRCVKDASNNNTQEQELEQRDDNLNSMSYNQLRWISNGTNATACPLPCPGCLGRDKKCINGVCKTGIKIYTGSTYNHTTGNYTCTYHYQFPDGSVSDDYTERSSEPCMVQFAR